MNATSPPASHVEPCICGSGRAERACHGCPEPWSAHVAAELDALAQIHDLPQFFPLLRPRGDTFAEFAEAAAASLGAQVTPVSAVIIEDGLRYVPALERQRLARAYETRHPDFWRMFRPPAGGRHVAARVLAAGAVRIAVDERRPRPRADIAALEDMPDEDHRLNALVAIVNAGWVWTIDEGWAAAAAPSMPARTPAWLRSVEEHAARLVEPAHVDRVQVLSARVAAQLPEPGLPRASFRLSEACDLVAGDETSACRLATLLLVAYAYHLDAHARRQRAALN